MVGFWCEAAVCAEWRVLQIYAWTLALVIDWFYLDSPYEVPGIRR